MINWAERAKAEISPKCLGGTAKTAKTPESTLLAVSSVPAQTSSAFPNRFSSVLAVPSPTVLEKCESSDVVPEDPDRWCWPHSSAMNNSEIAVFTARHARFTHRSISKADSDRLADKMMNRDRQKGNWFSCLECCNLAGSGTSSWHCSNWRQAGIALRANHNALPTDFVHLFQHCDGFQAVLPQPNL
jgi:hypothetical protein